MGEAAGRLRAAVVRSQNLSDLKGPIAVAQVWQTQFGLRPFAAGRAPLAAIRGRVGWRWRWRWRASRQAGAGAGSWSSVRQGYPPPCWARGVRCAGVQGSGPLPDAAPTRGLAVKVRGAHALRVSVAPRSAGLAPSAKRVRHHSHCACLNGAPAGRAVSCAMRAQDRAPQGSRRVQRPTATVKRSAWAPRTFAARALQRGLDTTPAQTRERSFATGRAYSFDKPKRPIPARLSNRLTVL